MKFLCGTLLISQSIYDGLAPRYVIFLHMKDYLIWIHFFVEFEVKVLEEHGFIALKLAQRVGGLFITSPSQFGRTAREC